MKRTQAQFWDAGWRTPCSLSAQQRRAAAHRALRHFCRPRATSAEVTQRASVSPPDVIGRLPP